MKYVELAKAYERLENTPSKLEKAAILADSFKKCSDQDLPYMVLLSGGRVFPDYDQTELGVAQQLVIKAISKAAGESESRVEKKFKSTGDLGLVVELFASNKKQKTLGQKSLTIEKVFKNIQGMTKHAGKGSRDRKLNLIAELLSAASPLEAKYIIRTVLQQLRIGIAEGIIRDAVAKAFDVSAESVENAWNMKSDFGEIALAAKKGGTPGLKKIRLELGKSVQVLLAEKAPDLKTALESFDNPAIEVKVDGMRAQMHKKGNDVWIYTRRLENVTAQFPDLVKLVRKYVTANECIIEGEVMGINPKTREPLAFQILSQRIHRKYDIEKTLREIPVQANLFDIIYLDGKTLFDKNLGERRKILERVITQTKEFKLIEQIVTKDLERAQRFYDHALRMKQEGVMVKNLDAPYIPGRSVGGGWLKVKPTMESLDLAIVGATWGTGKRAGALTSFMLACRDADTDAFLECGMMSTGIKEKKESEIDVTYEDMTKLLKPLITSEKSGEAKITPKVVIEVAYEEIQKSPTYSSGFALRFPRFLRLRPEKGVEQADTMDRVSYLYESQKMRK
ncbi:MAG: ATP-dependent DNA ligase [Candidatus Aenigmatarchaeota archaeon]